MYQILNFNNFWILISPYYYENLIQLGFFKWLSSFLLKSFNENFVLLIGIQY